MRCRAIANPEGYRIEGVKHFISNGGTADFIVVFAVADPNAGHKGISAFVVEEGTPGLVAEAPERTMGLKGGHVFELSFDCQIGIEQRVGPEGAGFRTAMKVLDNGRIEVAAMCIGIAQAALDAPIAWGRDRRIGGRQNRRSRAANPRRLWLCRRFAARALRARPSHHAHLRGLIGDSAHDHRARWPANADAPRRASQKSS
jgi:alkylation response protein AidB-like acyl-CoA dehydrogenase